MSPEAAWARLDMAVPQYECRSGCGSAWLIHPGTGPRRHTSINRSDTWALWRWVCHARMCAPPCSRVWLFETPWTVAHQDPLSMEFSRQEYWSGLPFPTPGDLPNPRIEPTSFVPPALAGRIFNSCTTWAASKSLSSQNLRTLAWAPWYVSNIPWKDERVEGEGEGGKGSNNSFP